MKIKEYIDRIVKNGKPEDMEELSEMLEETLYKIKERNEECYEDYKMELYEMAYGKVLTEDMAKKIVMNMKPYHEHWTMEQTTQVKNQYGLSNIKDCDFYVVMNSAYNRYHNLFGEDLEMYVKYAKEFINDEDAKEGKVYTYFTTIPKK